MVPYMLCSVSPPHHAKGVIPRYAARQVGADAIMTQNVQSPWLSREPFTAEQWTLPTRLYSFATSRLWMTRPLVVYLLIPVVRSVPDCFARHWKKRLVARSTRHLETNIAAPASSPATFSRCGGVDGNYYLL